LSAFVGLRLLNLQTHAWIDSFYRFNIYGRCLHDLKRCFSLLTLLQETFDMANGFERQRVAIAGTVINSHSREVMPYANIRITSAPPTFAQQLLANLQEALTKRPTLSRQFKTFLLRQQDTANTMQAAQILLDMLFHEYQIPLNRQDVSTAGGDGHYCFFDLPPGLYTLTATFKTLDNYYGFARRQTNVKQSPNPLAFSQVDIPIILKPTPIQIETLIKPSPSHSEPLPLKLTLATCPIQ
jgi:hypothetical protein